MLAAFREALLGRRREQGLEEDLAKELDRCRKGQEGRGGPREGEEGGA